MSSRQLLALILFSRLWTRLVLVFTSMTTAILGLLAALSQREFIDHLSGHVSAARTASLPFANLVQDHSAWIWLLLSTLFFIGSLLCSQFTYYWASRECIIVQSELAKKLYDKILAVQSQQLNGKSVGETVSIYTTDVPGSTIFLDQSLPQGFGILFPLILAPIVLIKGFGISFLAVASCLTVALSINLFLAYRQSVFFYNFKKLAADRIGLVNEWIQNIRALRVMDWISAFEQKIFKVRKIETQNRIHMLTNGQSMNAVSSSSTYLLNVIFVGLLVQNHAENLTPGSLLALLWIVAVFLNRPFRQLPWFFTFLFDGWTSLKRVQAYLAIEEINPSVIHKTESLKESIGLKVRGLNLEIENKKILNQLSFDVQPKEFIAVVGEVGAGKTSLLHSLIGETPASFDSYSLLGQDLRDCSRQDWARHFALVPQEGFVVSASLRENVVFEYGNVTKEDTAVTASLKAAQFDPQNERLNLGLATEIGERGVNLSGGQRQRVSIARADFFQREIMLLDDSFSALDERTEKILIAELFNDRWKDHIKIVATHRLTILEKADRVFFLKKGQLVSSGPFNELLKKSADFKDFVSSVETRAQAVRVVEISPEVVSEK